MALSEGFREFVSFITGGFNNQDDEGAITDVIDNNYMSNGNAALKTSEELDKMYGTKTSPRTIDFNSYGSRKESNLVTHPNSYKSNELTVIEPRSFSEAPQIIRKIIDKKTVVLHLDLLDKEQAQRTIDFVCGATHALDGAIEKITDKVFIFTPSNVTLSVENNNIQNKFTESLWNRPQQ